MLVRVANRCRLTVENVVSYAGLSILAIAGLFARDGGPRLSASYILTLAVVANLIA